MRYWLIFGTVFVLSVVCVSSAKSPSRNDDIDKDNLLQASTTPGSRTTRCPRSGASPRSNQIFASRLLGRPLLKESHAERSAKRCQHCKELPRCKEQGKCDQCNIFCKDQTTKEEDTPLGMSRSRCQSCKDAPLCRKHKKCDLCNRYCDDIDNEIKTPGVAGRGATPPTKTDGETGESRRSVPDMDMEEPTLGMALPKTTTEPEALTTSQEPLLGEAPKKLTSDSSGLQENAVRYHTLGGFIRGAKMNEVLRYLNINKTDKIQRLVVMAQVQPKPAEYGPPALIDVSRVFGKNTDVTETGRIMGADIELVELADKELVMALQKKKELLGKPFLTDEEVEKILDHAWTTYTQMKDANRLFDPNSRKSSEGDESNCTSPAPGVSSRMGLKKTTGTQLQNTEEGQPEFNTEKVVASPNVDEDNKENLLMNENRKIEDQRAEDSNVDDMEEGGNEIVEETPRTLNVDEAQQNLMLEQDGDSITTPQSSNDEEVSNIIDNKDELVRQFTDVIEKDLTGSQDLPESEKEKIDEEISELVESELSATTNPSRTEEDILEQLNNTLNNIEMVVQKDLKELNLDENENVLGEVPEEGEELKKRTHKLKAKKYKILKPSYYYRRPETEEAEEESQADVVELPNQRQQIVGGEMPAMVDEQPPEETVANTLETFNDNKQEIPALDQRIHPTEQTVGSIFDNDDEMNDRERKLDSLIKNIEAIPEMAIRRADKISQMLHPEHQAIVQPIEMDTQEFASPLQMNNDEEERRMMENPEVDDHQQGMEGDIQEMEQAQQFMESPEEAQVSQIHEDDQPMFTKQRSEDFKASFRPKIETNSSAAHQNVESYAKPYVPQDRDYLQDSQATTQPAEEDDPVGAKMDWMANEEGEGLTKGGSSKLLHHLGKITFPKNSSTFVPYSHKSKGGLGSKGYYLASNMKLPLHLKHEDNGVVRVSLDLEKLCKCDDKSRCAAKHDSSDTSSVEDMTTQPEGGHKISVFKRSPKMLKSWFTNYDDEINANVKETINTGEPASEEYTVRAPEETSVFLRKIVDANRPEKPTVVNQRVGLITDFLNWMKSLAVLNSSTE